jgi:malonyl-CoA/methylmalonyl-CoA synthetase
MNANLYALFERHFPDGAEQPCLVIPNGPVVHYDDLAAASAQVAHALVAAGCRPGDRVAAQVDKDWRVLALYLGCLRAGLVYLPLNSGYQKAELAYFFGDAEPRVIVCTPERLGVIATLARDATVLTIPELFDRAAPQPTSFDTLDRAPDDLAAILYTSGTTGRSKGAMLTHRNLASNGLALVEIWGFTRGDVLLHALPIYHVHGLFVATHCALLSGSRMLWLPKFDAGEVIGLLPRATVMMGVPTFYSRLLADPVEEFRTRTGHAILERYGMTEAGMITSNPLDGARVGGTVGKPLPGVELRVTGDGGLPCGPATIGKVEIRGPNVFAGYWRMPEKTREEFTADGWFRTGDVGEWVGDGPARGYVRLVGRAKDLIITGGLNVYPKEIEERIDALEGVEESAVIGVPDPDFGEAVAAVVVVKPGHTLTEAAVIGALKGEIASFKVPKRVHFAGELPRNAMGKVQKALLRERFSAS